MQPVAARLAALGLFAALLAGCGSGVENAPGPEAKSGKVYTKEDAKRITPKRGGTD